MPVPELLVDQQTALRDVMRMEFQYLELGDAIAACDAEHANTIALINNVLCILHLENRTGLKIFGTVIQRGLSNALGKVLFTDIDDKGCRFDVFSFNQPYYKHNGTWYRGEPITVGVSM